MLQSLTYRILPPERAAFLHDEGYVVDGKRMKLFALSWPISQNTPRVSGDAIEYSLPISLVISTPVSDTLDGLVGGALSSDALRLGNNSVVCESVEGKNFTVASDEIHVATLSPITCYSPMQRSDGRKYTVYFSPTSADFSESIQVNLIRKFRALHPFSEIPNGKVEVRPVGKVFERVAKFRPDQSFPIKGWDGKFCLKGPPELLQIGVDCGLGAKNSGGWGCVAPV
jgi:CRISPR-associated endoribonuclease Cas6